MNLLTKIILAVDSILLILVLVALIEGGVFMRSVSNSNSGSGHSVDPAPNYSTRSIPFPNINSKPITHPSSNLVYPSTNSLCPSTSITEQTCQPSTSLTDPCQHTSNVLSKTISSKEMSRGCVHPNFPTSVLQVFPSNGIFSRFIYFLWNVISDITIHDIIFLYIFLGIVYLSYNFYSCIHYQALLRIKEPNSKEMYHYSSPIEETLNHKELANFNNHDDDIHENHEDMDSSSLQEHNNNRSDISNEHSNNHNSISNEHNDPQMYNNQPHHLQNLHSVNNHRHRKRRKSNAAPAHFSEF